MKKLFILNNMLMSSSTITVIREVIRSPEGASIAVSVLLVPTVFLATKNNLIIVAIGVLVVIIIALVTGFVGIVRKNPRPRLTKPTKTAGSTETGNTTDYGYTFNEHYNLETDPSISFIRASKGDTVDTWWHRMKCPKDPIETRYYVIKGEAEFDLWNRKIKNIEDRRRKFHLDEGDSLVVPDSWWCRFNVCGEANELEMIVISRPRWRDQFFERCQDERVENLDE